MTTYRVLLLLGIIAAVSLMHIGIYHFAIQHFVDWQTRGHFGDLFGFSASLFSGIAFIFLLLNVLIQADHINLLKKDIADREETAEYDRSVGLLATLLKAYYDQAAKLKNRADGPEGAAANTRMRQIDDKIRNLEFILDQIYEKTTKVLGE